MLRLTSTDQNRRKNSKGQIQSKSKLCMQWRKRSNKSRIAQSTSVMLNLTLNEMTSNPNPSHPSRKLQLLQTLSIPSLTKRTHFLWQRQRCTKTLLNRLKQSLMPILILHSSIAIATSHQRSTRKARGLRNKVEQCFMRSIESINRMWLQEMVESFNKASPRNLILDNKEYQIMREDLNSKTQSRAWIIQHLLAITSIKQQFWDVRLRRSTVKRRRQRNRRMKCKSVHSSLTLCQRSFSISQGQEHHSSKETNSGLSN